MEHTPHTVQLSFLGLSFLYPDIFYREFGMKHIFVRIEGPDWDLGPLRELLQWRKTLG